MSRKRRNVEVGLCGGGLGGLMAAIALARGGAQVTVLKVNGAAPLPDEELEPLPSFAPGQEQPRQARANGR